MSARDGRAAFVLPAVALALLWALATTIGPFSDTTVNDLFVYRTYADLLHGGQLPYVDFGFEYPPLAAIPLWLAGLPGRDEATYAVSFAVLMAGFALVGQGLAARLAGERRAGLTVAWLLALSPVVIGASVRTHFDALPIALGDAEPELVRVIEPVAELGRVWRLLTTPQLRHTPRVAAFFDFIVDEIETLRPIITG